MDAMAQILDNATGVELRDLPPSTVERARVAILDTLAGMLAGSRADGIEALTAQARHWGGRAEARILVFGDRVPAPLAAQVNGTMARALDFDDCDEETGDHASVAAVPPALVGADMAGGVSGADLLAGVVVGTDAILRIRKASPLHLGPKLPWTTGTFAPLTGTLAAGRTLRLDRETFGHAVGIAFTELSNTMQSHLDGALAHRVHQGNAAHAALMAIALAQRGITGVQRALEGAFGVYPAYHRNEYDRERLLDGLGEKWLIEELSVKPFPCCKMTHGAAEGIMQLMRAHGIRLEDVTDAEVRVGQSSFALCARQPWRDPQNVVESQFNIPYVAGAALARRRVTLDEFTPEAIRDPRILTAAARVRPVMDPDIEALGLQVSPTEVVLTLQGGGQLMRRVDHVPGHPQNPLDYAAVADKFRQCAARTAAPLPAGAAEQVIGMVAELERVADVRDLIGLVAPEH